MQACTGLPVLILKSLTFEPVHLDDLCASDEALHVVNTDLILLLYLLTLRLFFLLDNITWNMFTLLTFVQSSLADKEEERSGRATIRASISHSLLGLTEVVADQDKWKFPTDALPFSHMPLTDD